MKIFLAKQQIPFIFLMLSILFFACSPQVNENAEAVSDPKADSTYFSPADSNAIVLDTSISNYSIKTILSPIKGKYLITNHVTIGSEGFDKIYYRDYNLEITIKEKDGISIDKQISKNEFKAFMTNKTPRIGDGYFMRKVKFAGIENDEFRFDIVILTELYNTEEEPKAIIKYYVSKDGKFRFE